MTVARAARGTPTSGLPGPHSRRARWSVGLAAVGAASIGTGCSLFAAAYAIGGSGATEDNWVGILVMQLLYLSLVVSLTSFVLAVVARFRHERWRLMWLPLSVFPALLAFLVLGEAFWWE